MQNVKMDIYISDLLYSYDCVIVPDFGGFVANYASAKVQVIQHQFNPPSKKISFNKNLKNNDGLLSNHIAERKSITYEEANSLIQSFVNQSLQGLQNGDKIRIENVGTLFLDPEQNVQFLAQENNDFLLDSFGLQPFKALPIQREGAEKRIKAQIKEGLPLLKEEEKKKRYYWPAAALLLLFIFSAFLLNQQFSWVSNPGLQYSAFSFTKSKDRVYKDRVYNGNHITLETVESTILFDKELPNLVFDEGIVPYTTSHGVETLLSVDNRIESSPVRKDNTNVILSENTNGLTFHVMGGCFSNLSNANGLVKNLRKKGFEAKLLGTYKKLHAVSFGSFASREQAIRLLDEVKNNDNPDAWLLVKPF